MTGISLAKSYLRKARVRAKVLDAYMVEGDYSDVVREAQEVVELALKAALRLVGVEPPKLHDVSALLSEYEDRLPGMPIKEVARISMWLRKEREFSFYGDLDLLPDEHYTKDDAREAVDGCRMVLEHVLALAKSLNTDIG